MGQGWAWGAAQDKSPGCIQLFGKKSGAKLRMKSALDALTPDFQPRILIRGPGTDATKLHHRIKKLQRMASRPPPTLR